MVYYIAIVVTSSFLIITTQIILIHVLRYTI